VQENMTDDQIIARIEELESKYRKIHKIAMTGPSRRFSPKLLRIHEEIERLKTVLANSKEEI